MSRGDPVYCKVDIDIVYGEKFSQLTKAEQHTYIFGPWMLAVKYKLGRLPLHTYSGHTTAARVSSSVRTVTRHLQRMHDLGLIILHENGDLTVCGVKRNHAKLRWGTDPSDLPHTVPIQGGYGEDTRPIQGIVREYESKRVRQSLNTNSIPNSYSGAVNVGEPGMGASAEQGDGKKPSIMDLRGIAPDLTGNLTSEEFVRKVRDKQDPAPTARYISGQDLKDASWRICNGLGIEDTIKNMSSLADMFHSYPSSLVQDAFLKTRDKQEADKSGTSDKPLENSPLAYMWGCMRREQGSGN